MLTTIQKTRNFLRFISEKEGFMERIKNIDEIWHYMGCDNCRNNFNASGTGPCENCTLGCENCSNPAYCYNCHSIPNHYVPKRNTIYEKVFYHEENAITQTEYDYFLKNPYTAI